MGRRNRQRTKLVAPVSAYEDPAGGVLALRGALKAGARRDYTETLAGGIDREDARQRATELLFERLAVSWEIAGVTTTSARDLLDRYRMASGRRAGLRARCPAPPRRGELPRARGAVSEPARPPAGAPDPDRFAALICDWCLELTPGARVWVDTTTLASDYARALQYGHPGPGWVAVRAPAPRPGSTPISTTTPASATSRAAPHRAGPAEGLDAFVRIGAPGDTRELAGVDPALIARVASARDPLNERMRSLRYCLTVVPTEALAEQAGMDREEYAAFVTRALFLDRDGPDRRVARAERPPGRADRSPRPGR